MTQIIHVLWSAQTGPICAYAEQTQAWEHASAMLGVEVSSAELRTELPDFAQHGFPPDTGGDATTIIAIEDLDDAEEPDVW